MSVPVLEYLSQYMGEIGSWFFYMWNVKKFQSMYYLLFIAFFFLGDATEDGIVFVVKCVSGQLLAFGPESIIRLMFSACGDQ